MEDVARHYGFEPNRSHAIVCPFHREKTASLKLYPGNKGFHCFGCHRGGSVIDFTAQLFGLDALGAVRRLDMDFSLGLPIDRPPTDADRAAAHHRAEIAATRRAFEEWRQEMANKLNSCIRIANQARPAGWDDLTEQQVLAIQWRDALVDYADTLMGESLAAQMEIFRDRKEVEAACNQILSNSQMKSSAA